MSVKHDRILLILCAMFLLGFAGFLVWLFIYLQIIAKSTVGFMAYITVPCVPACIVGAFWCVLKVVEMRSEEIKPLI
jgi:hypothetical protein